MLTTDQAAHCVNLTLMTKFAMESFSLEIKNYVSFHLLDDKIKKDFATTIQNRLRVFLKQERRNPFRISISSKLAEVIL
jgi:hypothetical protein